MANMRTDLSLHYIFKCVNVVLDRPLKIYIKHILLFIFQIGRHYAYLIMKIILKKNAFQLELCPKMHTKFRKRICKLAIDF